MTPSPTLSWTAVGPTVLFPPDCGTAVLVDGRQIAVFHIGRQWYAVQNQCPHNLQMVLSRGLVGDSDRIPKVTCPLHKNSFQLTDGKHLGGNAAWCLATYPVKVEAGVVWVGVESD
jgi:nitrite reductase (NADH) small subunit